MTWQQHLTPVRSSFLKWSRSFFFLLFLFWHHILLLSSYLNGLYLICHLFWLFLLSLVFKVLFQAIFSSQSGTVFLGDFTFLLNFRLITHTASLLKCFISPSNSTYLSLSLSYPTWIYSYTRVSVLWVNVINPVGFATVLGVIIMLPSMLAMAILFQKRESWSWKTRTNPKDFSFRISNWLTFHFPEQVTVPFKNAPLEIIRKRSLGGSM